MYTNQLSKTAQLKDAKNQIYEIMDALPCCLYKGTILKAGGITIEFISKTAADILGVPARTILKDSTAFYNAIIPEDRAWIYKNHKKLLRADNPNILDKDIRLVNGKWVRFRAYPKKDKQGNVLWDGIILDVSERKKMEEKLKFLALHDTLTTVGNRRLLFKELPSIIKNARTDKKKVAIVSFSLDGLGQINATHGLATGDKVIQKIIAQLTGILKKVPCLISRLEGNHFVITLNSLNTQDDAKKVVDKITKTFSSPILIGKQEFPIVVTIGVCFYPTHGRKTETLIANANAALDFAERTNKGSVCYFSDELSITLARNIQLLADLRQAISCGHIIPYFQPQVSLKTGEIIGIETLARWEKDNKTVIAPNVFIPLAEEYGLIGDITEQILQKACYHAKKWADKGYGKVPIAVNISGDSFKHSGNLISQIKKALEKTKLPPALLELELTESIAMLDPAVAIAIINKLEESGITCSIDDFGTGYSSLSVLKMFPLKKLKIDRSFVMDLNIDHSDTAIVRATIAIGKALGLITLAEGAESKIHIDALKKLGCDAVQGYFFSCPIPADKMEQMLKTWDAKKTLALITDK